jgi:hypothetical protein
LDVCVRYPPQLFVDIHGCKHASFPCVSTTSYCGEFKHKKGVEGV